MQANMIKTVLLTIATLAAINATAAPGPFKTVVKDVKARIEGQIAIAHKSGTSEGYSKLAESLKKAVPELKEISNETLKAVLGRSIEVEGVSSLDGKSVVSLKDLFIELAAVRSGDIKTATDKPANLSSLESDAALALQIVVALGSRSEASGKLAKGEQALAKLAHTVASEIGSAKQESQFNNKAREIMEGTLAALRDTRNGPAPSVEQALMTALTNLKYTRAQIEELLEKLAKCKA